MLDRRLADTVVLVRPVDFDYNEQTGLDNVFQKKPIHTPDKIKERVLTEFKGMVSRLRTEGVTVLILEESLHNRIKTPDSVFPNNWFSTEHDGTILTYPMFTENRRAEKRRLEDLEFLLLDNGYHIRNLINVGKYSESEMILEGTGAMVIDHDNEIVYAAQSRRCHPKQFYNFIHLRRYKKGILFETNDSQGNPIYHTNVLMSIGAQFAIVCFAAIAHDHQRQEILQTLSKSHDIIDISLEQMETHFCANILQLRNKENKPLIVMSENAFSGFLPSQKQRLKQYGKPVVVDIETIEQVGGGSARCMMAEIFSPRQNDG